MNLVGIKLNAVPNMKVEGQKLNPDAGQLDQLLTAAANVTTYQQGGQLYQNLWIGFIFNLMTATPNFWISVISYLAVSMGLIIISLVFITCLLCTDQRKWKNVAHISWINSSIMLFFSTCLAGLFSFVQLVLTDFCVTITDQDASNTVSGLDNLYPLQLQPFLTTCFYGKTTLIDSLKVSQQSDTLDSMNYEATNYLYSATLDQQVQYAVLTDEQTVLQNYINFPHFLEFEAKVGDAMTQPVEQLYNINQKTDLNVAKDTAVVCDSAKD